VNDPAAASDFTLPNCGTVKAICESEKPPTVYVPPLSNFCNCAVVKPARTHALDEASGAIAIKVGLLSAPFTDTWNGTVQPVGTLAGR